MINIRSVGSIQLTFNIGFDLQLELSSKLFPTIRVSLMRCHYNYHVTWKDDFIALAASNQFVISVQLCHVLTRTTTSYAQWTFSDQLKSMNLQVLFKVSAGSLECFKGNRSYQLSHYKTNRIRKRT